MAVSDIQKEPSRGTQTLVKKIVFNFCFSSGILWIQSVWWIVGEIGHQRKLLTEKVSQSSLNCLRPFCSLFCNTPRLSSPERSKKFAYFPRKWSNVFAQTLIRLKRRRKPFIYQKIVNQISEKSRKLLILIKYWYEWTDHGQPQRLPLTKV